MTAKTATPMDKSMQELRESIDTACVTIDSLRSDRARLIEALREAVDAADRWAVSQGHGSSILFYGFDTDKARLLLRELDNSINSPPYEWCHGSPTKQDCADRGYCNRDPNCGE